MLESSGGAVVLVWHGSGPREGDVMRPLVAALRRTGVEAFAVDWDSSDADHGRSSLVDSLSQAVTEAERRSVPCIVVGWSLGGTAALSLAAGVRHLPRIDGAVGLAVDFGRASPIDGLVPVEGLSVRYPLQLVHGRNDSLIAVGAAVEFAKHHRQSCDLTVVDSDHAGVVGAEWSSASLRCEPSESRQARCGLAAAVAAVERVLGSCGS